MQSDNRAVKVCTDLELKEFELKNKNRILYQSLLTILIIGVSIYTTIKNGFNFFTIIPLILILMFIPTFSLFLKIKKEIKNRKL